MFQRLLERVRKGFPSLASSRTDIGLLSLESVAAPGRVDIQYATRLAQQYAGAYKRVVHCEYLPDGGLYVSDPDTLSGATYFFFSVFDRKACRVGGTDYVAVSRVTGNVTALGRVGE